MQRRYVIWELWDYLRVRRKWWLFPVVLILVLVGAVLAVAPTSPLAPFIYALF
jgi:hypothetical protein